MSIEPAANVEAAAAAPRLLAVEGGVTVYEAHALKEHWLALLGEAGGGRGLQLDLSGVSEIDGAGVQLLLSARREALQRGLPFTVHRPSPVVLEAIALVGPMQGALDLPAKEVDA